MNQRVMVSDVVVHAELEYGLTHDMEYNIGRSLSTSYQCVENMLLFNQLLRLEDPLMSVRCDINYSPLQRRWNYQSEIMQNENICDSLSLN